ncbi:hypothetical protein FLK61_34755 [Paenalkalicoccus suaedae]|uniref:Uncharacterized protein n=1 Tax=Paenalkalicoccus suaedae TaxID=2592382 RepID=A0A859FFP1_9BACI|nr:hypothetical protein [Paenalkalicoccus suaedae]QKS71831.1 hypothetical protein FLK61_34755 [Paenalkalicoccus suaedae]
MSMFICFTSSESLHASNENEFALNQTMSASLRLLVESTISKQIKRSIYIKAITETKGFRLSYPTKKHQVALMPK